MKIILVSDSHGNNSALKTIASIHNDADYYFHLGDSESYESDIFPFASVKGNCDYFSNFPDHLEVSTKFGKIYLEHKPNIIRYNSELLFKKGFRFYFYGHTHVRNKEEINGITVINPGAINHSRDGNELSYCIFKISDDGQVDIKFTTLM